MILRLSIAWSLLKRRLFRKRYRFDERSVAARKGWQTRRAS